MTSLKNSKVVTFIRTIIQQYNRDSVGRVSAELAYFFLLSIFPLLIVITQLIRFLPVELESALALIREYAPEQAMLIIEGILREITQNQSTGLLSFGVIFTIWVVSRGIESIILGLDRAYGTTKKKNYFLSRFSAIIMTILMIFVIIFSLFIPVLGKVIGDYVIHYIMGMPLFEEIWATIRLFLSLSIFFICFLCLYRFLPDQKLKWREIWPGASFATFGWIGSSYVFGYYVENFSNYTATYGSLGGIIVLLLWFYITGNIILIGGEMNAVYYNQKREPKSYE